MKIKELYINELFHLKDIRIDFTYPPNHPKAGKALDKVCFIGKNGTGKTKILRFLWEYVLAYEIPNYSLNGFHLSHINWKTNKLYFENTENFYKLLLFFPAESLYNALSQTAYTPITTLGEALDNAKLEKNNYEIDFSKIREFWQEVIIQVQKRQELKTMLMAKPENKKMTIGEFEEVFERENPNFLVALQEAWAEILDIMGLYFDAEGAKLPFQLKDNLEAHIKVKKTNQVISYSELSTGIRNFIFKIGYLKSLFFGQENINAIAFVDEPENSLFPDVLANIVETYTKNAPNTQFFFATHSPIVASQFEPCERIILDFDEEKNVIFRKGNAPEGDDPNDLLTKDFGVANLLGKKGKQQLERYIELKSLIRFSNDEKQKEQYLNEFSEIGNLYGF